MRYIKQSNAFPDALQRKTKQTIIFTAVMTFGKLKGLLCSSKKVSNKSRALVAGGAVGVVKKRAERVTALGFRVNTETVRQTVDSR